MLDNDFVRLVRLIALVAWGGIAARAADPPPLLGPTEQACVDEALRCLKMTPSDLGYKKDYADSPFRLARVQRFLDQPLELPNHADDVMHALQRVQTLRELCQFAGNELELKPTGVARLDRMEREVIPQNAMSQLPDKLQPILARLLTNVAWANDLLENAFRDIPVEDRQRAVARYLAANLQLNHDEAAIGALGRIGLDPAMLREMVARDEALEAEDDAYARDLLPVFEKVDRVSLQAATVLVAKAVDEAVQSLTNNLAEITNAIPSDARIRIETGLGPVLIGGAGPTRYPAADDGALLILDLGGNDVYDCRAGAGNGLVQRNISICIDLGGDDVYRGGTLSQGAGLFGIGILVDCGGNDVYEGDHLCQGTGLFGVGILADLGGNDSYRGDIHCQGAGMFGIGVLWDRAGDDRYFARQCSQGYGYTGGVGLLLDENGNDTYSAGGKYSDHERLPEHYLSLSQGFGYGMRPDASGGVGILCDLAGNDTYISDLFGQGTGYWYGLGMLLDAQGNDVYRCYQYGQGAGIHLSAGILADWQGDDQYVGGNIVQGAAHDWSVGMLFDKQGTDQYIAESTAQGAALYNSVALLVDSDGSDVYASPKGSNTQAAGHDGSYREYGSIALLLDLGGKDTYSNGPRDDFIALKPLYGCAIDVGTSERPSVGASERGSTGIPHASTLSRSNALTFASSPTELSRPRDDRERRWLKLIRQAAQYSDTRQKAEDKALAFEELEHHGADVLPFWLRQLDHDNVMVRVRLEDFLDHFGPTNAASALIAALDLPNDRVGSSACYYIGKLKVNGAVDALRRQLGREKVCATALWALGELRAQAAMPDGLRLLGDPHEIVRVRAAGLLGKLGDPRSVPDLVRALDDPLWDERYAAETALIKMGRPALKPMVDALAKADDRSRPHLIEALGSVGDWRTARSLRSSLRSQNWLDRGTAVKAIAQIKPAWAKEEFQRMLKTEKNEFVRSRLEEVVP